MLPVAVPVFSPPSEVVTDFRIDMASQPAGCLITAVTHTPCGHLSSRAQLSYNVLRLVHFLPRLLV